MMLQELSVQLSQIIEQKRLKLKLEQDLCAVEIELQDQSARLESLSAQLEKEKVDVEKLERTSLTTLFYSVLGSREQQLEKERQEMLSAQLHYQQARQQVDYLEREQNYLLRQLNRLENVESEYQALLSEKERLLHQTNQPVANELLAYAEQIAHLEAEVNEINEAIAVGENVLSGLEQVIESLKSAENWGTWDMLGGGLLTTAVKHSRIDEARQGVNRVQMKMSRFQRELADVQRQVDLRIDIGEFESFADFFLDGLLVDWVVQSKISDSLARTKWTQSEIDQIVKELVDLKASAQKRMRELQEKRAQIIENTR